MDIIRDIRFAINGFDGFSHNDIGIFGIQAQGNAAHTLYGQQALNQIIRIRNTISVYYDTYHDLSGNKSLPNHDMTDQSMQSDFIIRKNMLFLHEIFNNTKDFFIFRHAKITFVIFNDHMSPSRIKSGDDPSVAAEANRKLGLISVMIRLLHADNGIIFKISDFPYFFQIISDLIFFKTQLFLIGSRHHFAPAAALRYRAYRFYPVRRRLQHLHKLRICKMCMGFRNTDPASVSTDGILDKQSISVNLCNTLSAGSGILNYDNILLILFINPIFTGFSAISFAIIAHT